MKLILRIAFVIGVLPLLAAVGPVAILAHKAASSGLPSYTFVSWTASGGGTPGSPTTVSFTCSGGEFVTLEAGANQITTFPTPTSSPTVTVVGPDPPAGLLFSPLGSQTVYHIAHCPANTYNMTFTPACVSSCYSNLLVSIYTTSGGTAQAVDNAPAGCTGTGTTMSCSATATTAGDLVAMYVSTNGITISGITAGYTNRSPTTGYQFSIDNTSGSSGTNTLNATASSTTNYAISPVTYK